jgi:hypothetical protein
MVSQQSWSEPTTLNNLHQASVRWAGHVELTVDMGINMKFEPKCLKGGDHFEDVGTHSIKMKLELIRLEGYGLYSSV